MINLSPSKENNLPFSKKISNFAIQNDIFNASRIRFRIFLNYGGVSTGK